METDLDTTGNDADDVGDASTACLLLTAQVLSFFPLPDREGLFRSSQVYKQI